MCDDRKLEVNLYNAGFIMLLSNVASYSRLTGFSRMSLTGNKLSKGSVQDTAPGQEECLSWVMPECVLKALHMLLGCVRGTEQPQHK